MYQAHGIHVSVSGKPILVDARVAVAPGKVVAIVGPNGAGKSTLLKVLAGERKPNAGEVTLDGISITDRKASELAARRAVLPQSAVVAFPFTVEEIVGLGLPHRFPRGEGQRLIERGLRAVDMIPFGPRAYDTLSGGERQRIQLARVLLQLWSHGTNGYLLLDEPTSSLDLAHQLVALNLAREHAAGGGGVLTVLHDINLAVMVADEILALKAGQVVASGPPAEVVTDALIHELYDVKAQIRGVPEGPFLLPQTVRH